MTSKHLKVIDHFLSDEECKKIIERFEAGPLEVVDRGIALYDRGMSDDPELAALLFERVKPYLPKDYNGNPLTGCNSRFRFSRYQPKGEFMMHRDGVNRDPQGRYTGLTLNIFLNDERDGLVGGSTSFYNEDKSLHTKVPAQRGRAGLFDREWRHTGDLVEDGLKYLLRTDVMVDYLTNLDLTNLGLSN